jgi:hypothetical protein
MPMTISLASLGIWDMLRANDGPSFASGTGYRGVHISLSLSLFDRMHIYLFSVG